MHFNPLTTLLSICALISQISALGINCRGSAVCSLQADGDMAKLKNIVQGIDQSRLYNNGFHIACVRHDAGSGTCAFLQGSDHQVNGGVVKLLIEGLVNHGCKECGSNPVYNFGATPSNDPRWGILTVNYVTKADNPCNGLC